MQVDVKDYLPCPEYVLVLKGRSSVAPVKTLGLMNYETEQVGLSLLPFHELRGYTVVFKAKKKKEQFLWFH